MKRLGNRWLTSQLNWRGIALGLLILAGLTILPFINDGVLSTGFLTCMFITMAAGWNILGGYTGQISFGHAAFYGMGVYTSALLSLRWGWSIWLTLPAAGVMAALLSLLVGLPIFRLRGPYFSIATIGIGEASRLLANNADDLTGGSTGLSLPLPDDVSAAAFASYLAMLAFMGLVLFGSYLVLKSKFGLGLAAIKMDQDAAETLGVNVTRYKTLALMLSAFIVGVCGGLYATYTTTIDPRSIFNFSTSIAMVLMCVTGGIGTLIGPVIGGVVYQYIQDLLNTNPALQSLNLMLYGLLLMAIILFEPGGVAGAFKLIFRFFSKRGSRSLAPAAGTKGGK